jgi:FkbM family methyltransferase
MKFYNFELSVKTIFRILKIYARLHNLKLLKKEKLFLLRGKSGIKIDTTHLPYLKDLIPNFFYYFDSVEDFKNEGNLIIKDFSVPSFHKISGFDLFDIHTPSLPEPVSTTRQYAELLGIKQNSTIFDLGAYSGLSSLIFANYSMGGKIIAVEADPINIKSCDINFQKYNELDFPNKSEIFLEKFAIWNEITKINFTSESSLGSAVSELLPRNNSESLQIETTTLSAIALKYELSTVDFLKADIEGSEYWAFMDSSFFKNYHPRIIFEPANTKNEFTKETSVIKLLESYGYKCSLHKQIGSKAPLILCE